MKTTMMLLLATTLASGLALAQALSGTIVGTVTDSQGAGIPSATVTLRNEGTGFTRTVETNQSGQYVAYSFPTGNVVVTVEHSGFQKLLRTGIVLTAADTLLILWFTRFGIRVIEAFVLTLVAIIGACFATEIFLAKPAFGE